jgi:hypothetical protein
MGTSGCDQAAPAAAEASAASSQRTSDARSAVLPVR